MGGRAGSDRAAAAPRAGDRGDHRRRQARPRSALLGRRPAAGRGVRRTAPPPRSTSRSRVARDALRRVVAGQELERTRLARELHDETGQALTSILLGLRTVRRPTTSAGRRRPPRAGRRRRCRDVRRLAVELRPSALDDYGLVLGPRAADGDGRGAERHRGRPRRRSSASSGLPGEVETALYRIVQEALTNIVKHAEADSVSVVLTAYADSVTVVIEDNGAWHRRGAERFRASA